MSYDLMVFAAEEAPRARKAFIAWFRKKTAWKERHGYQDPAVSTPELRAWLTEMTVRFPAMNGPLAPKEDPEDESVLTDYSIGRTVIYASFAWSKAKSAHRRSMHAAARHGVGVFEVSTELAEVWRPDGKGGLTLVHQERVR